MTILDAGGKLIYHYDRLYELMTKGRTSPVHITIGLTNYCNHKCVWCYIDFIRRKHARKINADSVKMLQALRDAKGMGVKAVTMVGDGEPTLHPDFLALAAGIRGIGLEIGIFTNGSWKEESVTRSLLENMTFVRFSIDAATPEMHHRLHRSRDFDIVLSNIKRLVKERESSLPTIGVQFAVNQCNVHEVLPAVELYKDIGVDYISFKPVYKNELNDEHDENSVVPAVLEKALMSAKGHETGSFHVLWKPWQMDSLVFTRNNRRPYDRCMAIWLSPYIDEDGNVEFCGNLKGRDFSIGNIYDQSFPEIWGSERHLKKILRIDIQKCPQGCKLHGINLKLWEIENPPAGKHQNFI